MSLLIKQPGLVVVLTAAVVALSMLGCGAFTVRAPSSEPASSAGQAAEIARIAMGPKGGKVAGPQGVEVSVPEGAFPETTNLVIYSLKEAPATMRETGATPAGQGFDITLTGGMLPAQPVEIRLPIKTSSGVDNSFYSVYASEDGKKWVDIGGLVEDSSIRAWTAHFTIFWPVRVPAPLRPIEFVNNGWFDARIVVDTYKPDPNYAAAARPAGVAVSAAPTSPAAPSPSRYLLLPAGAYTFCYDWYDGKFHHALTALTGLSENSPRYFEGAHWMAIAPGREAKSLDGPCPTAPPTRAGAGGPPVLARTPTPTATATATSRVAGGSPHTATATATVRRAGVAVTPTPTRTPTRTNTPTVTITPRTGGANRSPTPAPTRVNYLPYRNAWLKRCDDLRNEFVRKNCSPTYSGCAVDVRGMPTTPLQYLYTDYSVNLHRSYVTFAQSLEDQLLAALRKCFQEFIDNRSKIPNLDVRVGAQNKCIAENVLSIWDKESLRIHETSCRARCGEEGKIGVVEGVPRVCVCK
jgi:hypothetical protein